MSLLESFYPGQAGVVPYPVSQPVAVPAAVANHHNNIPDAGVSRTPLPGVIPVIDNSNNGYRVVAQQPVHVTHMPPTSVSLPQDMFEGGFNEAPADIPQPQPMAVAPQPSQFAPAAARAAAAIIAAATAQPIPERVEALPVQVEFGIAMGDKSEEFFCSYLDVLTHGTLLVFVNRTGTKTWFPADRDEAVAVRIGVQKLVHLARILPMPFSYGGFDFRFMLSTEQRVIE